MDRMLYVAMSGAKQAMEQQASVANNMANASTPGFRAQINSFRAVPVTGAEAPTRAYVVAATPGADFSHGPLTETGRALDVAVHGEGWLVVQTPDGGEAYTRVGNLQVNAEGQLTTMGSLPVAGDAGPLAVPPGAAVTIASNGLVTARGAGDPAIGVAEVGRLKLVNPPVTDLVRGDDGLFRMRPGLPPAETDEAVTVTTGAVEGSNVNGVEAMVAMIANARSFEMQMKAMRTADDNAQSANKLLAYG
ncbi:flagellar basal-body rod protein FlgF [Variovorax sp. TBS-050B]|uniref:flagellar basal body rod protein FlgF n=1 Tax=Variovorax sp. TBS-050B TaxID=2940551 RepID=UPI0024755924|nr:flagellar basal body rod protein FlgF [Variovorax sp. TBS-050B]MDH6591135.1 flagellar basal-body rod protein FlgF [Variovorax sp. TBS-050B]